MSESRFIEARDFADWRQNARELLNQNVPPEQVHWIDLRSPAGQQQGLLFGSRQTADPAPISTNRESQQRVPREFIELAKWVAAHRSPTRWELLYRMLWRLTHQEPYLLGVATDRDMLAAQEMCKAVRRDAHKMKAFVRFRKRVDETGDWYVAWHRPLHFVVSLTADFFARRFDVMRWLILTPDESVAWDGRQLAFGPGVSQEDADKLSVSIDRADQDQADDPYENLWKTYYAHIFNPARIKLKAMQAEMPKHHWPTLPETALIEEMLRNAPKRVEQMVKYQEGFEGAAKFIPKPAGAQPLGIEELRAAARHCQGCELYRHTSQVVFGVGPVEAKVVLVGEQPGDQEDIQGLPFVGPAGQLLRRVMAEVGLDIDSVYVTNSVKHFKFKDTPSRRLHVKPSSREISACQPWLEAELGILQPKIVVCLGATAATAIFGPAFRITQQRGAVLPSRFCNWTLATYHPSALLRVPDETQRHTMSEQFRHDLQLVADALKASKSSH